MSQRPSRGKRNSSFSLNPRDFKSIYKYPSYQENSTNYCKDPQPPIPEKSLTEGGAQASLVLQAKRETFPLKTLEY